MLTIRREQLRIFEEQSRENFYDDTAAYLTREYPGPCAEMGPVPLREFIRRSYASARRQNIGSRGAVMIFIELELVFGEVFQLSPDRPWAENILAHPTLPDYSKMEAVRERLISRSAGRVVRRAPPSGDDDDDSGI